MKRVRFILPAALAAVFIMGVHGEDTPLLERLRRLMLPDRVFRDESVTAILAYIEMAAAAADPEGVGVNLVVFDDPERPLDQVRLTLVFRSATVEQALRQIAAAAALTLQFEAHAVIVRPSRTAVRSVR